jgi:hypothetical protein
MVAYKIVSLVQHYGTMQRCGRWEPEMSLDVVWMLWLRLDLTHETDRLAAIASIVSCLQPPLNCKYVAGL